MLSVQLGDRFSLRPIHSLIRLQQFNDRELMYHNPWQYRVLSNWLVDGWIHLLHSFSLELPPAALAYTPQGQNFFGVDSNEWPLLLFKFLQNALLFAVAYEFYKLFTREKILVYSSMIILAYALGLGNFDSDLSFNSYFDVIFYICACLLVLRKKYDYFPLLVAGAALNRETSVLIPFLLLVAGIDFREKRISDKRAVLFAGLSIMVYAVIFFGLRFYYGYRPPRHIPGLPSVIDYWKYNLSLPLTYFKLLMIFSVLPMLSLLAWRQWPPVLRKWLWVILPAWIIVHFSWSIVAESRLFYVPVAVLFIPGLLVAKTPAASTQ
jgi:hypothetical protein